MWQTSFETELVPIPPAGSILRLTARSVINSASGQLETSSGGTDISVCGIAGRSDPVRPGSAGVRTRAARGRTATGRSWPSEDRLHRCPAF